MLYLVLWNVNTGMFDWSCSTATKCHDFMDTCRLWLKKVHFSSDRTQSSFFHFSLSHDRCKSIYGHLQLFLVSIEPKKSNKSNKLNNSMQSCGHPNQTNRDSKPTCSFTYSSGFLPYASTILEKEGERHRDLNYLSSHLLAVIESYHIWSNR